LLTVPSSEATAPLIMERHGGPQCATQIGFAPYVQAIEFYKALAENGAPVQILADPKAGHGPNDPQGFMDWWSSTVAWFARYGGIPIADGKLP
jgi:dipeptidyl aminopeptidase/acylaminoacyl peptidase